MQLVSSKVACICFLSLFASLLSGNAVAVSNEQDVQKIDRSAIADPTRPQGKSRAVVSKKTEKKRQSFVLSSIVYSDTRAQAVINGRFYQEGDSVGGAKVERILRDRIEIRDQYGARTLYWKPAKRLRRD